MISRPGASLRPLLARMKMSHNSPRSQGQQHCYTRSSSASISAPSRPQFKRIQVVHSTISNQHPTPCPHYEDRKIQSGGISPASTSRVYLLPCHNRQDISALCRSNDTTSSLSLVGYITQAEFVSTSILAPESAPSKPWCQLHPTI